MKKTCPLQVTVAGGNKLVSQYIVYGFEWTIQGQQFKVDVMLLPLEGYEMVLGTQWLCILDTSTVVNIRPYRYPLNQKDVTEQMMNDLLDTDVVRHSHIPFSSPIVMVKQLDVSWRMCIDYRQLNKNTIKDKFPFLVIEELIDEFHGVQVFSKLDLRITTPLQSKWLPKLLSFDYEIDYKKGKENVVANALSRVQRQGELFSLLSEVTTTEFIDVVK
ncbi:hypothetical protein Tco_0768361 [Tanacetum coccineum]